MYNAKLCVLVPTWLLVEGTWGSIGGYGARGGVVAWAEGVGMGFFMNGASSCNAGSRSRGEAEDRSSVTFVVHACSVTWSDRMRRRNGRMPVSGFGGNLCSGTRGETYRCLTKLVADTGE